MKHETCLDTTETKSYSLTEKGGTINFRGWNIKEAKKLILEELEEYYDEFEIQAFEIVFKEELAYSCSRYLDGSEASNDGYKAYMNIHIKWKRGLGKVTVFTIAYKLKPLN